MTTRKTKTATPRVPAKSTEKLAIKSGAKPVVAKPKVTRPVVAKSKVTKPKVTKPVVAKSQVTKAVVTKPKVTKVIQTQKTVTKSKTNAPIAVPDKIEVIDVETAVMDVAETPVVETAAVNVTPNAVERIVLPANLEMSGLDESFSLLRSMYPPKFQKCILDGVNINLVDTAGIQLLANYVQSVKAKGCEVEWDNYSIQVYQLASELGVVEQLGD